MRRRGGVVYVGLSGGHGQLIDALYMVIGRLTGQRLIIHHHSFAYLRPARRSTRWLLWLCGRATHIALAEVMRDALASGFSIARSDIVVISNAAFMPAAGAARTRPARSSTQIRIGFLSNITFDKGFEDFFRVMQAATEAGLPVIGAIAGPVASDAQATFEKLVAGSTNVEVKGPLYGEAKTQFYSDIDIFLFPTRYQNEAEPVVIHEALASGVFVIANDRGCIGEMLQNGAGIATAETDFVRRTLSVVEALTADPTRLGTTADACRAQEQLLRVRASRALTSLIDDCCR